jgi:hypothetical protein
MDLNAYHKAWMEGHKESEGVRIAEEAYFENTATQRYSDQMEWEHHEAMAREHERAERADAVEVGRVYSLHGKKYVIREIWESRLGDMKVSTSETNNASHGIIRLDVLRDYFADGVATIL